MRYDPEQSYDWNFERGLSLGDTRLESADPLPGKAWQFCGLPVASPIGIAAGPLLNGGWVLHYASQGFDILTYKTVRSRSRDCYALPNLVPIEERRVAPNANARASRTMIGSWGISFGMPSRTPDFWRVDVESTRLKLGHGRLLVVSVVASPEQGWTIEEVADDYAQCAYWASESGADAIELNLSCPNVASLDGQLYLNPAYVQTVLARVAERCPRKPLLIKIGYLDSKALIAELLQHCVPRCSAISMTNCLACTIDDSRGGALWNGETRGIGGDAIREESRAQVQRFAEVIEENNHPLELVGIGGISSGQHIQDYLNAGAATVQLATAAMVNDHLGTQIKSDLRQLGVG